MSNVLREYGISLMLTKLKLVGGGEKFFRQTQIKKWNLVNNASSGLKIINDVLWMRLLEVSEGMKLPNNARWFIYVPFWKEVFPKGKRFYRFRSLLPKREAEENGFKLEDVTKRPWEIHGF